MLTHHSISTNRKQKRIYHIYILLIISSHTHISTDAMDNLAMLYLFPFRKRWQPKACTDTLKRICICTSSFSASFKCINKISFLSLSWTFLLVLLDLQITRGAYGQRFMLELMNHKLSFVQCHEHPAWPFILTDEMLKATMYSTDGLRLKYKCNRGHEST